MRSRLIQTAILYKGLTDNRTLYGKLLSGEVLYDETKDSPSVAIPKHHQHLTNNKRTLDIHHKNHAANHTMNFEHQGIDD